MKDLQVERLMDYPDGANVITGVLISERERKESKIQSEMVGERLYWPFLALKLQEP